MSKVHAQEKTIQVRRRKEATFASYLTGFIYSVLITMSAYLLVSHQAVNGWTAIYVVLGLAVVQLAVQVVYFLHLGKEGRPRWNSIVFAFMVLVVLVFVIGSLWIMKNLNSRMMPSPSQMKQYMTSQDGL